MFLTCVARALNRRGWLVDVAIDERSAPLLANNSDISRIRPLRRFGPMQMYPECNHPIDLVEDDGAWVPVKAIYQQYATQDPARPLAVANYYGVTENCTLHPDITMTQISDFQNVYNEHLGWAGIAPSPVPHRRPVYSVTDKERAWAAGLELKNPVVLLPTYATSPAGTSDGRAGRPAAADWFERASKRASMVATSVTVT